MNDQTFAAHIGKPGTDGHRYRRKIKLRYAIGIGFEAWQIAYMVRTHAMGSVCQAIRVEVPASAHAVAARAIAFLMHMETVLGIRFETRNFASDPDHATFLREHHLASGSVSLGRRHVGNH